MPTDTERREVARRLRELDDSELQVYDMTYFAIQRAVWGDGDRIPDGRELADRLADLIEPATISGETSDGYHTFDELYDHRAKLFSVIVRDHRELAWKSRLHHDGTMYDGMFIVGVETPRGQATYHYDVDPYWGLFDCKELDRAPEWDGHTPAQAIDRIAALGPSRYRYAPATRGMSQGRRDAVARDPTERGIDSIYDWCFAAIEGADGAEDELYCSIIRAIEDYRHPERVTARTARPVDRDALLALADELDAEKNFVLVGGYARRIREACGEARDGD